MKQLPHSPSLTHLKHQAKDLLKLLKSHSPEAFERLAQVHPRYAKNPGTPLGGAVFSLSDAQFVVAREYGIPTWPKLKAHVESLNRVQNRVTRLREAFAAADENGREELLKPLHTKERFKDFKPGADVLSEPDAKLLVANQEGYALWEKYESYLNLDPAVQDVIAAARQGDLNRLEELLRADPGSANPHWIGAAEPDPIPNDSIPLFCACEGVFNGTNRRGNVYQIVQTLVRYRASVEIERGTPLNAAVSYDVGGAATALLEAGARVDGSEGDGAPMAYALFFGHTQMSELLAKWCAKVDLRFAAGLGRMDRMLPFFNEDGSLASDAGALADPYENRFRCERTRANVLNQALLFAVLNNRLEAASFLLERGADAEPAVPGMPTTHSALDYARYGAERHGYREMLTLLETATGG